MSEPSPSDSKKPARDAEAREQPNRLASETSAYLRQHMFNPVDWHPWGPEALELARDGDRPLLVSIGYSACHWCHVMERESFEDRATAELMNRHFVCIKVDREERPDIDQIYMDTVTGLTGHGGWPLTVFCRPDGTPFYGGTYFPPEPRSGMPSFQQVLASVERTYRERRSEVDDTARRIVDTLSSKPPTGAVGPPGEATLVTAAFRLLQRADTDHGGFGTGPKFPTPPSLEALLAALDALPERKAREALDHLLLTCTEMARGGLYDHVGGGFHRYTVDGHWGIPHFEKMLYDEGQLLRVYVETWRRTRAGPGTKNDDLVWPIRESVDFLRREMTAEDGGWFASQDADSEGEEGIFYVWTPEQVEAVLGADRAHTFCAAYSVTQRGNFEHGTSVLQDVARETREDFAEERRELLKARASRVAPGTDTKRVASWNAYTISGLARAGSLLGDASMLDDAIAAADFVFEKMTDDTGRLLRVFNQGRAHVPAFLDDVASLLEACLDLYRAGAGARFAGSALRLADDVAARFFDAGENDLFLTPNDAVPLAIRPRSDHDGATPHSCGLAVLGLLRVASLSGRSDLDTLARGVLDTHAVSLERGPESLPTLSRAALLAARTPSTAVILGAPEHEQTVALATAARLLLGPMDAVVVVAPGEKSASYLDPAWLLGRNPVNDAPTAYVCRGTACTLPVNEPAKLALLDDTTRSGV